MGLKHGMILAQRSLLNRMMYNVRCEAKGKYFVAIDEVVGGEKKRTKDGYLAISFEAYVPICRLMKRDELG